jgi:ABC-2 type transport system ATP-binding protein
MQPSYATRSLRRCYAGDPPVAALDGIDLEIGRAEIFGLLGPNGAGKTTLARTLIGLSAPDEGSVTLFGREVTGRPQLVASAAAYLAQEERALAEIPVRVAIETTARLRGLDRAAARRQVDELVDEFSLGGAAGRPMNRLSGGQRRVAALACALVGERPVLVLDEPTAGLDPQARRAVWAGLHRRRDQAGTTVILITHNVVEAESVLDRVAVLDHGRVIACDTPGRLKTLLGEELRLELVWREAPPLADPLVARLSEAAAVTGRRWTLRMPPAAARETLNRLTGGPLLAALDDFTLATPSLEDVYLALGGRARDLERV